MRTHEGFMFFASTSMVLWVGMHCVIVAFPGLVTGTEI